MQLENRTTVFYANNITKTITYKFTQYTMLKIDKIINERNTNIYIYIYIYIILN